MSGRERILRAIARQSVDRVPVDFGGTRQSGISAIAYRRLRERLGLRPRPVRVFDLFQMLADIEQEVADRFGADCVALNRPQVAFGITNANWKPFVLFDGTPVEVPAEFEPSSTASGDLVLHQGGVPIAIMPRDGFYFDRLEKYPGALHPDLAAWEPPRLSGSTLEHFHHEAVALHSGTDKAIIAALGPPFELFNGLGQGGFEDWMITFASEPDYVGELYEKLVTAWIDNLKAFRAAVGDRVHIIQICDDFGSQHAPLLSVRMFRDRLLPMYQRGLDWIHVHTPWKVMLHSDGALFPLLPSIIEMGVDILNPVQTTAAGMEAARLKAAFGQQLVFWGGSCDSQQTLTFGTPEDVVRETRRNLEVMTRDGGYVFAPVHNIQANVPPENILALFDTALSFKLPSA